MESLDPTPQGDWTVAELFAWRPAAVVAFSRLGMACAGCAMAPYETVAEVAATYRLTPDDLLRIASGRGSPDTPTAEEAS